MKIITLFKGVFKTYKQIWKDYESYVFDEKIFRQERDGEKMKLLVEKGYVKPTTTIIGVLHSGLHPLKHYTPTKKGSFLKKLILFSLTLRKSVNEIGAITKT